MTAAATAVRERPLLMSGPMVRAILDGRKTQTRRVLVPQPDASLNHSKGREIDRFRCVGVGPKTGRGSWEAGNCAGPILAFPDGRHSVKADIDCPFGHAGTRLWVREAWTADFGHSFSDNEGAWWHEMPRSLRTEKAVQYLYYAADGAILHPINRECSADDVANSADARASSWEQKDEDLEGRRWVPSIHMPRWASRITLEILGVRVERLQSICQYDAANEIGMDSATVAYGHDACADFASLWDSLNVKRSGGAYSWASNPWVWCLSFRRVTP
jgi:hypothetical protein